MSFGLLVFNEKELNHFEINPQNHSIYKIMKNEITELRWLT